jgi:myosin heavy chain 6/7
LSRAKLSLEKSLEELEENLELEKKGRADLDKNKRKVEGELKSAQAAIEEVGQVSRYTK